MRRWIREYGIVVFLVVGIFVPAGWLVWAIAVHGHWWSRLILVLIVAWAVGLVVVSWRHAWEPEGYR